MTASIRLVLLLASVALLTSCASESNTAPPKNLKLQTIDHGPLGKTYLYRQVHE